MVGSSQYPEERQTRRVLELSFPEVDADVRENLAYLVSVRRMTLDEALNELEEADKRAQSSRDVTTANGARRTTTAGKAQPSSPTGNGRYTATTTTTSAARSNDSSKSLVPAASTATTEAYTQRYANRRRATRTAQTTAAPPSRRTSGSSDSDSYDGSGGAARRGEAAQRTSTTVVLPPATQARSTAAAVPRRSTTDTSSTAATQPVLPPTCTSPTRGITTTADSGRGRPGPYSSSKRTDACFSRSDSELTEIREAALSLVRSEENSRQSSAPDVLSGRPSAAAITPTQRRSGPSTAAPAVTRASRQAEEGEVETLVLGRPVESKRASWARPTDEELRASKEGEEVGEEPMFTNTKLVTDDEKAVYEERMRDMMHYWYRDETSMYDYTLRSLPVGQVLFFTTSMTGERRVRDHCRLMENLLYLKLIPHHTIDVADSEFFLRRVRRMYTHATKLRTMPELPLLFVDDTLIGDFTTVQELEDAGELDAKMLSAGCSVLRPRVVAECEARLAGLPGAPLILPTNPPKMTRAKTSKAPAAAAPASSGGASPPMTKPQSTAPPAPTPTVAFSGPRELGGDVNGEERMEGATRSPMKPAEAAKAALAVTARPPPSSRVPSTAKTITTTTTGSALAKKGAGAAAVHDHPAAVDALAPSSGCRFSNGRRLDRTPDTPAGNDSPVREMRRASAKAVSTPADEKASNPSSVGHTVRTSARASLVKTGAQGRTSTTENAEWRPPTSTVPGLPLLSSQNAGSRDEELQSPLADSTSYRRYGASSGRSSATVAVASRLGPY